MGISRPAARRRTDVGNAGLREPDGAEEQRGWERPDAEANAQRRLEAMDAGSQRRGEQVKGEKSMRRRLQARGALEADAACGRRRRLATEAARVRPNAAPAAGEQGQ
ncbi:hypothetical protein [Cohnella cellulosilytica]|uniref:hypothetical protein n=1 Tax=Cohnella cellulosilytica TaxID=986710 RepID=UPI00360E66BA